MNTKKSTRMHYIQTALLFASMFAAIPIIDALGPRSAQAADPAPTCQNLTAEQSDDKNYYSLTVTALAANEADINGYQFDFGDYESYTFDFDNHSNSNRQQATVRHTYEKAGTYTVVARVVGNNDGKVIKASSPGCTIHITIAATTELPATGPNPLTTVVIASVIGLVTYAITLGGMRKASKL